MTVAVEVPGRQAPWVKDGQRVDVVCPICQARNRSKAGFDRCPTEWNRGGSPPARSWRSSRPPPLLQGGMVATVTFRIAVAELDPFRAMPSNPPARKRGEPRADLRLPRSPRHDRHPGGAMPARRQERGCRSRWATSSDCNGGARCIRTSRLRSPVPFAAPAAGWPCSRKIVFFAPKGEVLAVPQSAVVDTGARQVVFVETMPGMFDALEVVLGPRCGDFYPVVRGLAPGQAVAIAGAFLLDAETRLNPSLAASYFGAGRGDRAAASPAAEQPTGTGPAIESGDPLGKLDPALRALAERQRTCPVTGQPLGSMGPPKRITVLGRIVFLCCEGCESRLRREPAKYLAKLPAKAKP